MASQTARPSLAGRGIRGRRGLIAPALLALAAIGWWITDQRMGAMPMGPSMDGLVFYTTIWVAMMAAMMFPSVWPVVTVYDGIRRASGEASAGATALMVGGYLIAWTAWGLVAFGLIAAGNAVFGDSLSWDGAGRWASAGVLVFAALYQLTPLKNACLTRCRGPLMFVMENWRPDSAGAVRMGLVHGAWCVGCCWALMAALLAIGVMNVGWMALIAGLIAVEKLVPWRPVANYGVSGVLLLLALGVAAGTW